MLDVGQLRSPGSRAIDKSVVGNSAIDAGNTDLRTTCSTMRRNIWGDWMLALRLMIDSSAIGECYTVVSGARVHICGRMRVAMDAAESQLLTKMVIMRAKSSLISAPRLNSLWLWTWAYSPRRRDHCRLSFWTSYTFAVESDGHGFFERSA
jgi:hypothetical protein